MTVDADTRVRPDTIGRLVAPFEDPKVGGVSGNVEVATPRGWLGAAQQLEYVIGNAFDRRALDVLRVQVTIPGATGAFRRSALDAVGGFSGGTVAEDTDLTLAVAAAGWDVRFAPEARSRTSTPEDIRTLWRQRSRWSFGITQAVWRRREMIGRWREEPRAAAAAAYLLASQVLLPALAPLLDLAAIWAILDGSTLPLVLWGIVTVFQLVGAVVAVRVERRSMRLLWAFPLHLLGYRQLTSIVGAQSVAWAAAGRWPAWGRRTMPRAERAERAEQARRGRATRPLRVPVTNRLGAAMRSAVGFERAEAS